MGKHSGPSAAPLSDRQAPALPIRSPRILPNEPPGSSQPPYTDWDCSLKASSPPDKEEDHSGSDFVQFERFFLGVVQSEDRQPYHQLRQPLAPSIKDPAPICTFSYICHCPPPSTPIQKRETFKWFEKAVNHKLR
ncbi:unnamed protein product, partial [Gadus morhua 'NCC']